MDKLTYLALLSTIRNIKQRKLRENECQVTLIWGDSNSILPQFAEDTFDLVYVDGSHYYEQALFDIREAKRITKSSGGIICGDDLEKLPSNLLVNLSEKNRDRDYIEVLDGLGQSSMFHPGVLLAIAGEFKDVNVKDGFWWIHKHENNYVL